MSVLASHAPTRRIVSVTFVTMMLCATLALFAPPAVGEAPVGSPFGVLDQVFVNGAMVHVAGWAKDPDRAQPIEIHVYVDGEGAAIILADRERPDLLPMYEPGHGFEGDLSLVTGDHEVCLFAINAEGTDGDNVALGCRDVHADGRIVGAFDGVDDIHRDLLRGTANNAEIRGWAVDPDDLRARVQIQVYLDGEVNGWLSLAMWHRYDVERGFPAYGEARGIDTLVFRPLPGPHEVCVKALNVPGTPGEDVLLGCKSMYSGKYDPMGRIDFARPTTTGVQLAGWVVDPGSSFWEPGAPASLQGAGPVERIKMTVDGLVVLEAAVNVDRPDVVRAVPAWTPYRLQPAPRYGFDYDVALSPGPHRLCVVGEHHPLTTSPLTAGADTEIGCVTATRQ